MKRSVNRRFDLIHINKELTSYTYPIIKLIICIIFIALLCLRGDLFPLSRTATAIIGWVALAPALFGIYCIYISVFELFKVHENRKKAKRNPSALPTKSVDQQEILRLVRENDIVEIEALHNKQIVHLGTSAESHAGSSRFFNKRFYIDDREYLTEEEFIQAIAPYLDHRETVQVYTIDGLKP